MKEYYIQDTRGTVGNSMLWWALEHKGYCCDIRKAHVFTEKEAIDICAHRNTDVMWEKEYIDNRISHHIDHQHCSLYQMSQPTPDQNGELPERGGK